MNKISTALASALIIIALTIGVGIGYYLTPEYRLGMYEKTSMDLGQADRWLDLRYINAMISHHRAAMILAEEVSSISQRPEIKELAAKIIADEPPAIDELYQWKSTWYNDERKVKDPITANLGSADEKADLRFLNALIAHHEAGLIMTKYAKEKSSRNEILNNADAVELFLTTTLEVLKEWRKEWYQI